MYTVSFIRDSLRYGNVPTLTYTFFTNLFMFLKPISNTELVFEQNVYFGSLYLKFVCAPVTFFVPVLSSQWPFSFLCNFLLYKEWRWHSCAVHLLQFTLRTVRLRF